MKIIKSTILFLFLLAVTSFSNAQQLVVEETTTDAYDISDVKTITFCSGTIVITTTTGKEGYALTKTNKIYFENLVSATNGFFSETNNELIVFPNPVAGNRFTVNLTERLPENYQVYIYDLSGNRIDGIHVNSNLSGESFEVTFPELETGIYLLKIEGQNYSSSTKVTIN